MNDFTIERLYRAIASESLAEMFQQFDDEVVVACLDAEIQQLAAAPAEQALARVNYVSAALGLTAQAAAQSQPQQLPRVVGWLSHWISKLQAALQSIKANMAATSISITFAAGPVSVGVTW